MRLKVVADAADGWPRVDFDGALDLASPASAALDGQAVFTGATPAPWRLAGPLRLDDAGGTMEKLDLRLGEEAGGLNLQGAATIAWGEPPRLHLSLNARQLDLDRFATSPFAAAARGWLDDSALSAKAPLAVDLTLGAPAATLGGEPMADIAAHVSVTPMAPVAASLAVGAGPGGSRLSMRGEVETGVATAFRGRIEAGARDAPRLAGWLNQLTGWSASLPSTRALDVAGDFTLSAAGFSVSDLKLKADRTSMGGAAAYTRAIGGARARLFVDLSSDTFDIDATPDLTGATTLLANMDLRLTVAARAIRVARFGAGTVEAGHISATLSREGDALTLENLSIADLGGASLRASGTLDPGGGWLDGDIDAARLGDLAAFLRRVAPGAASEALAARATALSPARATFHARAARPLPDAALALTDLTVDGTARGSAIKATARPEGNAGSVRATLSVASPDAAMLLRQLGIATTEGPMKGEASIELAAIGRMDDLALDATARFAGSTLGFHGALKDTRAGAGDMALDTPDAAPLMRLLGYPWPDASVKIPARMNARLALAPREAAMSGLSGAIAGTTVAGDLKFANDATGSGGWTGDLRLGRLSLPSVAVAALGPARSTKPGEIWSTTPFAAGMPRAPTVAIDVTADELRLAEGMAATNASLRLSLGPGLLRFENIEARDGAARVAGELTLERNGPDASAKGSITLDGWRMAAPALSGTASGAISFSGTGASPAALMRALVGQGDVHIAGMTIPRADPDAPARVMERAESGNLFISENDFMGALRRELDQAPYRAGDRAMAATVAAGAIRLAAQDGLSIAYDPSANTLETRVQLAPAKLPSDWQGPPPRVGVVWRGPITSPTRDIEAGVFNAALTARAVAREQARVEALEADARERAFFNRRRKGLEFLNQRAREIEAIESAREPPPIPPPPTSR